MNKKIQNNKVTEEEAEIFRQSVKDIQQLKSDKVALKKKRIMKVKVTPETYDDKRPIYLSDESFEKIVSPEQQLFFCRSGLSPKQVKKLKQGKIPIEAKLDLHGFVAESAREALITFLDDCYNSNKRSVLIIHGKGHTDKPVLKNKLNNWLRQFDCVLAFASSLPRHGGAGAVYVLLRAR